MVSYGNNPCYRRQGKKKQILLLSKRTPFIMYRRMVATKQKWTAERIKALRDRYGETQDDFRARFRISLSTLRFWEQGQGEPSGPATVILDQLEADAAIPRAEKRERQPA